MKLCECGCNQPVTKQTNHFIAGHNFKTSESRQKVSQRMKQNNPTKRPEIAKKISIANKGRKPSLELRLRWSLTKKQNLPVGSFKKGQSSWSKGLTKYTDERVMKTSKKLTGKKLSEKHVFAIRKAHEKRKGKTYLELYGPEKAKQLIEQRSGDKAWSKRPEARRKVSIKFKGKSYEERFGIEKANKIKKLISEVLKGKGENCSSKRPEVRAAISKTVKELWKQDWYREKVVTGILGGLCPHSKHEYYVNEMLQKLYPDEFIHNTSEHPKFVSKKVPDFYHKSLPILIELFGDYWHGEQITGKHKEIHEQEMIEHYKKSGYACLVFWEYEIQSIGFEQLLIERLSNLLIKNNTKETEKVCISF